MTLVSHTHRFVYLKTRKTAGTTAEMVLQRLCLPEGVTPPPEETHAVVTNAGVIGMRRIKRNAETEDDKRWYNHAAAAHVCTQLGRENWDGYLKITSIREPFDRTLSYFFWSPASAGADTLDFDTVRGRFNAWVMAGKWRNDRRITHRGGDFCADVMIRYEHLREDLATVIRAVGGTPDNAALPETKITSHRRMGRPVAEFYDAPAIAKVRDNMGWVFEHGGYAAHPADLSAVS